MTVLAFPDRSYNVTPRSEPAIVIDLAVEAVARLLRDPAMPQKPWRHLSLIVRLARGVTP